MTTTHNPCYVLFYKNDYQEREGYLILEYWCNGLECWTLTDVRTGASRFTREAARCRVRHGAYMPNDALRHHSFEFSLGEDDFDPEDCVITCEYVPEYDLYQLPLIEDQHVQL